MLDFVLFQKQLETKLLMDIKDYELTPSQRIRSKKMRKSSSKNRYAKRTCICANGK